MSDPLNFTGIDLGERAVGARKGYGYQASDDEGDGSFSSSDDDDEDDDEEEEEEPYDEREEALVQSALARIRRAQDRGKKEVKLNKEELAALERRRRRIAEEEARIERRRRQEKEQRFSVPLSQLAPTSRKRQPVREPVEESDDGLPRHPEPADVDEGLEDDRRQALPPMGYFPPPNVARNRPRSATSASQRPPSRGMEERGPPPPNYPFNSLRHPSDSYGGRRTSRSTLPPEDAWPPKSSPASSRTSSISRSRHSMDPYQFQKENSRAPPPLGPGAGTPSRRPLSGTMDPRRPPAPPATSSRGSRDSRRPSPEIEASEIASETSDPDTSDDLNNGVQIVDPPRRGRREQIVVEEEAPTPRHGSRGKKSSANTSPSKRKPVGSGGRKKRK